MAEARKYKMQSNSLGRTLAKCLFWRIFLISLSLCTSLFLASCGDAELEEKAAKEEAERNATALRIAAKKAEDAEKAAQEAALDNPVAFKCEKLEAVLLKALNKPDGPISRREMLSLTNLNVPKSEITDLSGLHYAKNLVEMNLRYNLVEDLSPLAYMTNLLSLNVADNKFKDVTPLTALTNLESLTVSFNKLSVQQEAVLEKALPNCEILF